MYISGLDNLPNREKDVGSNPATVPTTRSMTRNAQLHRVIWGVWVVEVSIDLVLCPVGEIGRRMGLKIPRRKVCRFDSGTGHQL